MATRDDRIVVGAVIVGRLANLLATTRLRPSVSVLGQCPLWPFEAAHEDQGVWCGWSDSNRHFREETRFCIPLWLSPRPR
jgi:hypothetical protein